MAMKRFTISKENTIITGTVIEVAVIWLLQHIPIIAPLKIDNKIPKAIIKNNDVKSSLEYLPYIAKITVPTIHIIHTYTPSRYCIGFTLDIISTRSVFFSFFSKIIDDIQVRGAISTNITANSFTKKCSGIFSILIALSIIGVKTGNKRN